MRQARRDHVPSGTTASAKIPASLLAEGGTYSWRVRATDGVSYSAWPWCEFTVDTTKPGAPFVSSALYPPTSQDSSWGHGGAGQAGDFVFTPANGTTDVAAYVYQQDVDTAPTTVAASGPLTVSVAPKENGRRTLTVRAKDRAGNLSEAVTYTFVVGRAGMSMPQAGANVVKRTKLAVTSVDTTLTRATFQYRRGPGGAEYDIPLAHLRKADGSGVAAYPVRLTDLGANGIWNAVDTLGTTGGVVQVRANLYPDADGAAPYQTGWTTVNVDTNGDGAAGDSAGPGSVNLLTGDYTLSSTDADEFGLSVSRTASSREPTDGWLPQGERLTANVQQVSDINGFTNGGVHL